MRRSAVLLAFAFLAGPAGAAEVYLRVPRTGLVVEARPTRILPAVPASAISVVATSPAVAGPPNVEPAAQPLSAFGRLRQAASQWLSRKDDNPKPALDALFTEGKPSGAPEPVEYGSGSVSPAPAPVDPRAFVVRRLSYNHGQRLTYRVRHANGKRIEQFWLPGEDGKERLVEQRVRTGEYKLQLSRFTRQADGRTRIETRNIDWRGEYKGFGSDSYVHYLPSQESPLEAYYSFTEILMRPMISSSDDSRVTYFRGAEVLKDGNSSRSTSYGSSSKRSIVDGDGNVLESQSSRSK